MNFRTSFALKAGLLLGVVVGSIGLSACGGGASTPSGGSAPEIVITPPANRAPMAVESIPVQTLTLTLTTANARIVDVATYFMDSDNNQLTYSAVSDRQDILEASMSDSMMTLTPVSAGTATVTVTASDGYADAIQTFDTVVQPRENRQTSVRQPVEKPVQQPVEEPVEEPVIELTGADFGVYSNSARSAFLYVDPVPAEARFSSVGTNWEPYEAGRLAFRGSSLGTYYFWFFCDRGYNDNVTISFFVSGSPIETSVTITCR